MAYMKTKLEGSLATQVGTTGSGTAPSMPNSGVSFITATSAEAYNLQPPIAGCDKTLVWQYNSTSALPVVRASTATGVITFVAKTTGLSIMTLSAAASTLYATVVQLKGVNSTSWLITNVTPCTTTPTGTNLNGSITLSS